MSIKKAAMKILHLLKGFFEDDSNNRNSPQADVEIKGPELPPLTVYEARRKEIAESTEPIEGIFYIFDGRIIPDYYSECLMSDKDDPRREKMYHHYFHPNYMQRKFTDRYNPHEKFMPRGRITGNSSKPAIYIDRCYEQDEDTLRQLRELYRLPENTTVLPNANYRCRDCSNKV